LADRTITGVRLDRRISWISSAGQSREQQVHQQQVNAARLPEQPPLRAGKRLTAQAALPFQIFGGGVVNVGIVFNDQDAGHGTASSILTFSIPILWESGLLPAGKMLVSFDAHNGQIACAVFDRQVLRTDDKIQKFHYSCFANWNSV